MVSGTVARHIQKENKMHEVYKSVIGLLLPAMTLVNDMRGEMMID